MSLIYADFCMSSTSFDFFDMSFVGLHVQFSSAVQFSSINFLTKNKLNLSFTSLYILLKSVILTGFRDQIFPGNPAS